MTDPKIDARVAAEGLREAIESHSWELVEHYTEKVERIARGENAFPIPQECHCYDGGPDNYDGPQRDCPEHGGAR